MANLVTMTEYAERFADFLESVATRIRALSVDRANRAITIVSLALPALVLAVIGIVLIFVTIYTALAIPLGPTGAYAIMAGLFLVAGLLAWGRRTKESK